MKYLNLACGAHYIDESNWINVDFQSDKRAVIPMNIIEGLPFETSTFELIYCSHFIEHLHLDDAVKVLKEARRVLKPGGVIRLVLPDLEEIASEYLKQLSSGNILFASFARAEILDQLTRRVPSGQMKHWYALAENNPNLRNYMKSRIGFTYRTSSLNDSIGIERAMSIISNSTISLLRIKSFLVKKYCYYLTFLFPKWFRNYHIALTSPGERHQYVHDFPSIRELLVASGFNEIQRVSHKESLTDIADITRLDVLADGGPRGGLESMFVEAK